MGQDPDSTLVQFTAPKCSDTSNRKQKQMARYFKLENYFHPQSFLLKEIFVSYTESKVQTTLEALIYTCHLAWPKLDVT